MNPLKLFYRFGKLKAGLFKSIQFMFASWVTNYDEKEPNAGGLILPTNMVSLIQLHANKMEQMKHKEDNKNRMIFYEAWSRTPTISDSQVIFTLNPTFGESNKDYKFLGYFIIKETDLAKMERLCFKHKDDPKKFNLDNYFMVKKSQLEGQNIDPVIARKQIGTAFFAAYNTLKTNVYSSFISMDDLV